MEISGKVAPTSLLGRGNPSGQSHRDNRYPDATAHQDTGTLRSRSRSRCVVMDQIPAPPGQISLSRWNHPGIDIYTLHPESSGRRRLYVLPEHEFSEAASALASRGCWKASHPHIASRRMCRPCAGDFYGWGDRLDRGVATSSAMTACRRAIQRVRTPASPGRIERDGECSRPHGRHVDRAASA